MRLLTQNIRILFLAIVLTGTLLMASDARDDMRTGVIAPLMSLDNSNALPPKVRWIPKPTTEITISANLPSGFEIAPVGVQFGIHSSFYDSLGETHILQIALSKISPSRYGFSLFCNEASFIGKGTSTGPLFTNMTVDFNGRGQPISFDGACACPQVFMMWNPCHTTADSSIIFLNLGTINSYDGFTSLAGPFEIFKNVSNGEPYRNYE